MSGSLLGSLSMFLYSMDMLSEGIQAACGNELKAMLRVLSYNRFVGFLTGIAVCAITNSLSCVAVLLVSFVSADLIPLERCLGILLLAVKLSGELLAPPVHVLGVHVPSLRLHSRGPRVHRRLCMLLHPANGA